MLLGVVGGLSALRPVRVGRWSGWRLGAPTPTPPHAGEGGTVVGVGGVVRNECAPYGVALSLC